MTQWRDTLVAVARHAEAHDLPDAIVTAGPGQVLILGVDEAASRRWAESLTGVQVESHLTSIECTGRLDSGEQVTVQRYPATAILKVAVAAGLTLEETVAWFDAWPSLTREQQIAAHLDMVERGVTSSWLPPIPCGRCGSDHDPARSSCGECTDCGEVACHDCAVA
jgi:hypothetical protein